MTSQFHRILLIWAAVAFAGLVACAESDDDGPTAVRGEFIDSAVEGLAYAGPNFSGTTDADGGFEYVEGDHVTFSVGDLVLGMATGETYVTPLDVRLPLVEAQTHGLNVARLLQSLDANGDASDGIELAPEAIACLNASLDDNLDLRNEDELTTLLEDTHEACAGVESLNMAMVSADDAASHLMATLEENDMYFLRNISNAPELDIEKSKFELLRVPTAGATADGTATGETVLPLVVTFNQLDPDTLAYDVFLSLSLDNGETWRTTNVSLGAEHGSFVMPDGTLYPGSARKANLRIFSRFIFMTWTSTYCPDATPADLPEADDLYGVNGDQGSVDYAAQGFPEVGLVPYRCVWSVRGQVQPNGNLVMLMPEQLTSGRRDALQDFPAGASNAGFAVAWQEDPAGLNPGSAEGPGHGWSGAVANKRTDIWYSHIAWSDFFRQDPDYDATADPMNPDGRPHALVPLASPVRLSDNSACRYREVHDPDFVPNDNDNASGCGHSEDMVTEAYCADYCVDEDEDGFCVTEDGRALRGNTAATRPNLFLINTYDDEGNITGAEAILGYEETKGTGDCETSGLDEGKYIRFHHMPDFTAPPSIDAGAIFNPPNEHGEYENARRIRFVIQQPPAWGPSDTSVVGLYRMGLEGQGHPADIFIRVGRGGYALENFGDPINLSSVDAVLDPNSSDIGWEWSEANFADESDTNPFDDARAHRGQLRGDFIVLGYTWTPNWGAATIGADHYDFFVRRSFDGGDTWTNAAGEVEAPVNMSQLPNHLYSVIEPRIVATPGTVKVDGVPSENPEWRQNKNTYFIAFGTETNSPAGELEVGFPADLYFARTTDRGETYETVVYTDGEVTYESLPPLAATDLEEGECQMRPTPGGNWYYAVWNAESPTESDTIFRRVDYTEPEAP